MSIAFVVAESQLAASMIMSFDIRRHGKSMKSPKGKNEIKMRLLRHIIDGRSLGSTMVVETELRTGRPLGEWEHGEG
jgi:hypothetical protein